MTRQNMRSWSPEVAALLNPAFIALLLVRAVKGYYREADEGMPYVYVPIIATISLYPAARETLSMNVATQFTTWIDRASRIQGFLQGRIVDMVPIVNEGLLFALVHGVLRVEGGVLIPGDVGPANAIRGDTADMEQAQRVAAYLGRWLVRAGNPSTVCAMLGVTP
jgi:Family of unknown function (DUF6521)